MDAGPAPRCRLRVGYHRRVARRCRGGLAPAAGPSAPQPGGPAGTRRCRSDLAGTDARGVSMTYRRRWNDLVVLRLLDDLVTVVATIDRWYRTMRGTP